MMHLIFISVGELSCGDFLFLLELIHNIIICNRLPAEFRVGTTYQTPNNVVIRKRPNETRIIGPLSYKQNTDQNTMTATEQIIRQSSQIKNNMNLVILEIIILNDIIFQSFGVIYTYLVRNDVTTNDDCFPLIVIRGK